MKRKLWYAMSMFFVFTLVWLPLALAAVGDAPQDYFSNEKKAELSVAYKLLYAPIWGGDVRQRVFYNGCNETIFGKYPPSEEMNQIWALLKNLPPKKVAVWGSSYYMRWAPINGVWTVVEGDIPPGYLNGITRNNKDKAVFSGATAPAPLPKATQPDKVMVTEPLPKTPQPAAVASQEPEVQTQLNAIRAKLAHMAPTKPAPAAKAKKAEAKKAPAVDASAKELAAVKAELAACNAQAKKLEGEKKELENGKAGLEKSLAECQVALKKAAYYGDWYKTNFIETWDKKEQARIALNVAKASLTTVKEDMYASDTVVITGIICLVLGLLVATVFARRKK